MKDDGMEQQAEEEDAEKVVVFEGEEEKLEEAKDNGHDEDSSNNDDDDDDDVAVEDDEVTAPLIGKRRRRVIEEEETGKICPRDRNGGPSPSSLARILRGASSSSSSALPGSFLSSIGSGDGYDDTIARMPVVAAGTRTQYIKVNPWTRPEPGDKYASSRKGVEQQHLRHHHHAAGAGNGKLDRSGGGIRRKKHKGTAPVVSVHSGTSSSSVQGPGLLRRRRQIRRWICCFCLCGIVIAVISALSTTFYVLDVPNSSRHGRRNRPLKPTWLIAPNDFPLALLDQSDALLPSSPTSGNDTANANANDTVPPALLQVIPPPYDPLADFCNDQDRVPPFWDRLYRHFERSVRGEDTDEDGDEDDDDDDDNVDKEELEEELRLDGNHSDVEKVEPEKNPVTTWGPCYPPDPQLLEDEEIEPIDWPSAIRKNRLHREGNDTGIRYPRFTKSSSSTHQMYNKETVPWNLCRPGFLIIGAGKCGTSSLYHYLVGHPRVLPASEKQIHYFKYYTSKSLSWYYSHFADTETFLSSGALLTGEASPGYLPYPDVAKLTAERLPGPRIIVAGRDPLHRAWSSYNYNYVNPTLKALRVAGFEGIEGGRDDEYYRLNHLFTFEEMVAAELQNLKSCLEPGGWGEQAALSRYEKKAWVQGEMARRREAGEPGLIDLEADCYPLNRQTRDRSDTTHLNSRQSNAPEQWKELMASNPDKVWDPNSVHLTRSLVGRGLYVLPLEWWFVTFPASDIYFMCTEHLRDDAPEAMADLSDFLGLPRFDGYANVVSKGVYNMGGHQGYDVATPWHNATAESLFQNEIPISEELLQEFQDFVQPLNQRLFRLTRQACPW